MSLHTRAQLLTKLEKERELVRLWELEESLKPRPIETAPKDGTPFLVLMDGAIYKAKYFPGESGLSVFCHLVHEPKKWRIIQAEMDGEPIEARVMISEGPLTCYAHYSSYVRGWNFNPSGWFPLLNLEGEK